MNKKNLKKLADEYIVTQYLLVDVTNAMSKLNNKELLNCITYFKQLQENLEKFKNNCAKLNERSK